MTIDKRYSRHPEDPNLRLLHGHRYNGYPLVNIRSPFVINYLDRIDETINKALSDHPHVIAARVDLHFPQDYVEPSFIRHSPFSRFIDSLRAKIDSRERRIQRSGKRVHPASVHYLWTKEQNTSPLPHYHAILFFNKQTFRGLNVSDPKGDHLYGLISQAWASALRLDLTDTSGLVYVPKNPVYHLRRDQPYPELFHRASYLAKLDTKCFGDGSHRFGCSR